MVGPVNPLLGAVLNGTLTCWIIVSQLSPPRVGGGVRGRCLPRPGVCQYIIEQKPPSHRFSGGMAGVVGGGAVLELHSWGLRECRDVINGTMLHYQPVKEVPFEAAPTTGVGHSLLRGLRLCSLPSPYTSSSLSQHHPPHTHTRPDTCSHCVHFADYLAVGVHTWRGQSPDRSILP